MDCKLINPLEIENWDDLLMGCSNATYFHTQGWAKALCNTYRYQPRYFSIIDQDVIRFLFPLMEINSYLTGRRGVSLPFTDYMLPILSSPEQMLGFWSELIEFGKEAGWQHIDVHGEIFQNVTECNIDCFYQHNVDLLHDADEIFLRFSDNNKRNIKKALREGVEVEFSFKKESIDDFFNLNMITRKRHGLPSQPYEFFQNLHKHVISEKKGIVVLARHHGKTVAGSIFLLFRQNAMFKYGASNNEGRLVGANNLVMWETIKWLSAGKYKTLCLGRTETENHGLRRYKNGWSPEEKIIYYYRYDIKKGTFVQEHKDVKSYSKKVFKVMPLAILKILGRVLYKHVG